jgi:hypothetical protein
VKFSPKSEEELRAEAEKRGAWPNGVYDAEIVSAEEKISSKGNDMIEMTLNVYHEDTQRQMKDWLVEAMAFKLRHCCEAAGLSAAYEAGTLDAWQLESKAVKVKLTTETYIGTDGVSRKRNKIADYVTTEPAHAPARTAASAPPRPATKPADPFGDDIPF